MIAFIVFLVLCFVGISLAISFHLTGLARELEMAPAVIRSRAMSAEAILAELENPVNLQLARSNPAYAAEFLLFSLQSLERDLRVLMRTGAPFSLLPQFLVFRLYLSVFRVKSRLRADLGDLQYLIGYEFYLLRRLSNAA